MYIWFHAYPIECCQVDRPVPEDGEEPAAMEQYRKEVTGSKKNGILMGFDGILWWFHVI
jgi:hypothetical protein